MRLPEEAVMLRVLVGEQDMHGRIPLYEAIVMKARELNVAGATVLRGVMGFGASSRIHTAKILRLSEDMPMIIEIVDSEDRLEELLQHLDHMVTGGLITMERIRVKRYRTHGKQDEN